MQRHHRTPPGRELWQRAMEVSQGTERLGVALRRIASINDNGLGERELALQTSGGDRQFSPISLGGRAVGTEVNMSSASHFAMPLVVAALPVLSAAAAQTGLPDGTECAPERPDNLKEASARCRSRKCAPGPSIAAKPPAWYCVAEHMACALPGREGATADTLITLSGTTYQCLDPRTGDPHRFAPIR